MNIAEGIENDVVAKIISFVYKSNLEIPGYDLKAIYSFIDRDENADDYDPDDDDYDIREIYSEISDKMDNGEIDVPTEFAELRLYFERLFWPNWEI